MRLSIFHATADRVGGAAFELVKVNNDRAVRVVNILASALFVPAFFQLFQWISIRNFSVFIGATSRTPAAAFHVMLERDVQRRAIHSSLSARNNFHSVLDRINTILRIGIRKIPVNPVYLLFAVEVIERLGPEEPALGRTDEPLVAVGIITGFANRIISDHIIDKIDIA